MTRRARDGRILRAAASEAAREASGTRVAVAQDDRLLRVGECARWTRLIAWKGRAGGTVVAAAAVRIGRGEAG